MAGICVHENWQKASVYIHHYSDVHENWQIFSRCNVQSLLITLLLVQLCTWKLAIILSIHSLPFHCLSLQWCTWKLANILSIQYFLPTLSTVMYMKIGTFDQYPSAVCHKAKPANNKYVLLRMFRESGYFHPSRGFFKNAHHL